MYAATTKDEGNAADGRFSTASKKLIPESGSLYPAFWITLGKGW